MRNVTITLDNDEAAFVRLALLKLKEAQQAYLVSDKLEHSKAAVKRTIKLCDELSERTRNN